MVWGCWWRKRRKRFICGVVCGLIPRQYWHNCVGGCRHEVGKKTLVVMVDRASFHFAVVLAIGVLGADTVVDTSQSQFD